MKHYKLHLMSEEIINVHADTHWFTDSDMLVLGISDGTEYANAYFVIPIFRVEYFYILQLDDKEEMVH